MKLPGGDQVLRDATIMVFDYWQNWHAQRNGGKPKRFSELSVIEQQEWLEPQRAFAEMLIVAMLTDQMETVTSYDGCQGGAYERAIVKYAAEELGYKFGGRP